MSSNYLPLPLYKMRQEEKKIIRKLQLYWFFFFLISSLLQSDLSSWDAHVVQLHYLYDVRCYDFHMLKAVFKQKDRQFIKMELVMFIVKNTSV